MILTPYGSCRCFKAKEIVKACNDDIRLPPKPTSLVSSVVMIEQQPVCK